jgi:hypothetical protein
MDKQEIIVAIVAFVAGVITKVGVDKDAKERKARKIANKAAVATAKVEVKKVVKKATKKAPAKKAAPKRK